MTRHTLKPRASAARLALIAQPAVVWIEDSHAVGFETAFYREPLPPNPSLRDLLTSSRTFYANIRTMLVGATIVGYAEGKPELDGCDPSIILTLEKKGVRYRVEISPSEWMSVSGFDEDVPALRLLDGAFKDVYVLPDPPVPDDYRPFLSRFGVVSRREDRP